ncbi:MAG: riboflavin synthase [Spirochaetaceae bacterium]|nr:riboflavin synthase [Spirochaetaceae bacterium]
MFTGIIEEIGVIRKINKTSMSANFLIESNLVIKDLKKGESLSVNGICLTVTTITKNLISVDVMNETIKRTNFSVLKENSKINLERAMKLNSRLGGHIVSGHVDGTGTIISIKKESIAIWYEIKTNSKIMQYIIEKGSIAIDGISLTVAKVNKNSFSVSIIPHTISQTILHFKKIGSQVNIENDLISKYIEKLISPEKKISKKFLLENGFY